MKKIRKIVAATLATATVATMVVTASAARADIRLGAITPTYSQSARTIYAYDLSSTGQNTISFSSCSKNLTEGNVLFTVDFNRKADILNDDYSELTENERNAIPEYMASLRLDRPFIYYMGAGYDGAKQYPLEVANSYYINCKTVIVGSDRVFKDSFNITSATCTKLRSSNFYRLTIDYRIGNHFIIPEWHCVFGTEACNPYFYDTEFNNMFSYNNKSTTGKVQIDIRPENIGKNLPLYVNSQIVAYMTISSSGKVTFTNC